MARLYRDEQLEEALSWKKRSLLSLDEEAFLQASASEHKRQQKRYRRRTLLVGLGVTALGLVAASTFSNVLFPRNEPSPPLSLPHTYRGHTDAVTSVAWSPDGTCLASASADTTVRVWDTSSGASLFTYRGHTDFVTSVAWSSDGTRLASASADTTVRVWDATSGQTLRTYRGHTNIVTSVAWSPDGTRLASASFDNTVQIWDATSGQTLFTYHGHPDPVTSVAWSPDGKRLASASGNATVRVWLWLQS